MTTYKDRDLRYNNWHRQELPRDCYALDIDLVEFRASRGVVAITEIKNENDTIREWQNKILIEIAKKLEVPIYLIIHKDLVMFKVINLITKQERLFDEQQYKEFIVGL